MEPLARPKVLLLGDPSARPTGLERALTRAGFQLVEPEDQSINPEADAILISVNDIDQKRLAELLPNPNPGSSGVPPRVVIIAATSLDAPAKALALGAADALAAPIHLPELCARLHARIRDRLSSAHGAEEQLGNAIQANARRHPEDSVEHPESEAAQAALDRRMREEFERARRYSLSFSLVLLGVDELRSVREHLGVEAAEKLKADVASALRRELRLPDFVVSYGTSEFAIVLPETGQIGARQSVMRVRERLALVPRKGDPRLDHPRFSAGIVTYPHPAVSQTEELYAMAEAALMRGKAQSGERIGVAL
ncbi:MAG: diguanylate cyclase [Gemmatimonadales bacterium]